MIGTFTDLWMNIKLDLFWGGTPYTPPRDYYFGLSRTIPNRLGLIEEPEAQEYARRLYPNVPEAWAKVSDGQDRRIATWRTNAKTIVLSAPQGDWGWLFSVFMADAATGGNVFWMAPLTKPGRPVPGIPVQFDRGSLMITDT